MGERKSSLGWVVRSGRRKGRGRYWFYPEGNVCGHFHWEAKQIDGYRFDIKECAVGAAKESGGRIVRVYAKPKAPDRKSLGQVEHEAYCASFYGDGGGWSTSGNSHREACQLGALAVAEEVRRRFEDRCGGDESTDEAWDAIIAEIKEGK